MDASTISHILYQLGEENFPGGVVSPPIYLTSNFSFQTLSAFRAAIANEKDNPIYSRGHNPTVRLLEKKLAALQGTEDALCFSSGSAAISAAVTSCVKSGDHVISVKNGYSWTTKLLQQTLSRFGVQHTLVDGRDTGAFEKACRKETSLVILESPTSLTFQLQDLRSIIEWARSRGLTVICDNSYGSPLNRKPAEFGADLICHSATKFIGGHSDVVAGVVCGSQQKIREIFFGEYMTFGAMLPADQAWLLIRSLRTIVPRIQSAAENARRVVAFLRSHPFIEEISWPFDPAHPQHHLAIAQFDVEIPMFSFQIKTTDESALIRFCETLRIIRMGVSWGGYESLILPAMVFQSGEHPVNMFRLYCGLEDGDLLISDLSQALGTCAES